MLYFPFHYLWRHLLRRHAVLSGERLSVASFIYRRRRCAEWLGSCSTYQSNSRAVLYICGQQHESKWRKRALLCWLADERKLCEVGRCGTFAGCRLGMRERRRWRSYDVRSRSEWGGPEHRTIFCERDQRGCVPCSDASAVWTRHN